MSHARVLILTSLAMLAFAGNSLLCRMALKMTAIDAASFTGIRLVSGALVLWLLVSIKYSSKSISGNWPSALALFGYAITFSFAYISLQTGMGALLLFGAVQITMAGYGLYRGERYSRAQLAGFIIALAGLLLLLIPGLTAPPLQEALLMVLAGIAWGIYSLRGRGASNPLCMTAGNFIRTIPMVAVLGLVMINQFHLDMQGMIYAVISGALTSGVGYAIWYAALPGLKAAQAASVQLSVPVIAAFGGVVILNEHISLRLLLATFAILGGIVMVIRNK